MATRTAAQRRTEERAVYDAYLATCPARQLLDRISDKWVSLALNALADGPLRYRDLNRIIAGVSQKMLTQTLRALERDGLVTRTVTPSVPVRVDYRLTPLGRSLLPVMASIKAWAESHIEEVRTARTNYDRARPASHPYPVHDPRRCPVAGAAWAGVARDSGATVSASANAVVAGLRMTEVRSAWPPEPAAGARRRPPAHRSG